MTLHIFLIYFVYLVVYTQYNGSTPQWTLFLNSGCGTREYYIVNHLAKCMYVSNMHVSNMHVSNMHVSNMHVLCDNWI